MYIYIYGYMVYIYISFSAMNLFHTFPSLRGYVTCGPLPVKPWNSAPDFEALKRPRTSGNTFRVAVDIINYLVVI